MISQIEHGRVVSCAAKSHSDRNQKATSIGRGSGGLLRLEQGSDPVHAIHVHSSASATQLLHYSRTTKDAGPAHKINEQDELLAPHDTSSKVGHWRAIAD